MTRKERYQNLIRYFTVHLPVAETELTYENDFQLLVAVILSAQCTDKRVNQVTPVLFEAFPTPAAMAKATFDELHPYIKSISYPNNKTKHLIGMAQLLVEKHNGKVPDTREQLIELPGVGRKTANVILSVLYDQPTMAVDTHVFRVSKRIGLVNQNAKTPLEVEKQLLKYLPEDLVAKAHHWLILHGRYTCTARSPACTKCKLRTFCRYQEKQQKTS
ncbi:MAG: endonuclease III [Thermonemataceae bacterium]